MDLSELQRLFSQLIRSEDAASHFPIGSAGLRIYRNNYRAQLKGALRDSFPHVQLWLGHTEFDGLADIHIDRSPPASWTLDDYGHDFPSTARSIFPDDPEVWELAWLDLAMAQAFVAADEDPIAAADLAELDWDTAHITFVPSLRFTEALSNAAEIWNALENQSVPPRAAVLDERAAYVVWRQDFVAHFRLVSLLEYQVMTALYLRFSFAEACEILRLQVGDGAAIVAAGDMLGRWLSDGLIAKVENSSVRAAAV
jgi:hypothetical protein